MRDPSKPAGRFSVRDLSESMIRFSWSMSLFGLQQFAHLLRPDSQENMDQAAKAFNDVTRTAKEQLGDLTKGLFNTGDQLQHGIFESVFGAAAPGPCRPCEGAQPGPAGQPRLAGYQNDAREEIIIRFTKGLGRFSTDKKYIALQNKMFKTSGEEDGYHEGVWEASFKDPKDLLLRPDRPQGPMNEPVGPVPHVPVAAYTKAHWVFADSSSITVVGPASSHLVPLDDGSFLFFVSTAQIITGGTGRYEGAYGLAQSLGATRVPKGVNLFGDKPVSFSATTFDTFRVVKGRDILRQPAGQPGQQPQPPQQPSQQQPSTATPPSPDYPYQAKFVDVRGSRMHYIEEGTGDPILFLHGNPTWSYLWRNVIPRVKSYGRCVAPDLIGMGMSDKPAIKYTFFDQASYLEGFIQRLDLRNITLVLHDWGTALGFYYAMRNQDNIKGIAFLEAMLKPYESWDDFPASLRDTFRSFRAPELGWDLIVDKNVFIEQVLPNSVIRRLTEKEMNYYREPFLHPDSRKTIYQFVKQLPVADHPKDVAKAVADYSRKLIASDKPKLLIYAEPGAITTAKDVLWCQQNLKNLRAVSIGPGIHFHQEDNPEGVGNAVADWYQQMG